MTDASRTSDTAKRERIIREMADDLDEEIEMELDDSGSTNSWTKPSRPARRSTAASTLGNCSASRANS